ncbi:MAG: hypothetical protein AAB425_00820, partial [Bdellovibrionota bacterium]
DGRAGVGPFYSFGVYCAYEKLPTFGFMIVERGEAATTCDQNPIAFNFNHMDIVKPAGGTDYRHLWVKSRIKDALNLAGGTPPAPNSGELFTITGQARRERNPGTLVANIRVEIEGHPEYEFPKTGDDGEYIINKVKRPAESYYTIVAFKNQRNVFRGTVKFIPPDLDERNKIINKNLWVRE